MPERVDPSLQLPGYSAGSLQIPGQAKRLSARAGEGMGELAAEAHEAQRMFRTSDADEYTAPLKRRTRTLADITHGLGLDQATEDRVQKLVAEQSTAYTKKGQTQRSFLANSTVVSSLRGMRGVSSDARMEIAKRARAYWRTMGPVDYGKEPTVRAPQKTQAREDTRIGKSAVRLVLPAKLMKAQFPPSAADVAEAKRSKSTKVPKPTAENPSPAPPAPAGAAPKGKIGMLPGGAFGAVPATQPPALPAAGGGPAAQAQGGNKPPPGFVPMQHSSKGGYKSQDGSRYWYPGSGVTSTPHPADAQAEGHAPPAGGKGKGPPQKGAPPFGGGAQHPPAAQAPGGAPQGAPGGAQPPPLPGPPQAGAGPTGQPPQAQGPGRSTPQPQVQRGPQGETRSFHPQVQAVVPPGKENDHLHHAGEFKRHQAMKQEAMRQGDYERAKGHTYAMNFHADKHNRLLAQMQGRDYEASDEFPGAADEHGDAIREGYDRVPGQPSGPDGKPASAAAARERFVPESQSVKGMRERIGRAVNIMADLSSAHDHLASLKQKALQVKQSGHPLARRMLSQLSAEMAATKHDIVQLEDAHEHAMKEVGQAQSAMRGERIRANPVFQAFMNAMQGLQGLSQKVGAKLSEGAAGALDTARGAITDIKQQRAHAAGAEGRQALDTAAAQQGPESEVKPLGVSREDVEARFGTGMHPKDQDAEARRVLESLDEGDEGGAPSAAGTGPTSSGEEASPEDVEELPDDAEMSGDEEQPPEDGGEGEGSEAEAAVKDIFNLQGGAGGIAEQQQRSAKQQGAQQKFQGDISQHTQTRDTARTEGAARAKAWAEKNAAMLAKQKAKMAARGGQAALAPTFLAGQSDIEGGGEAPEKPGTSAGTAISGVRRKQGAPPAREEQRTSVPRARVKKSAILVKSMEWAEVMRLGRELSEVLRKADEPVLAIPLRKAWRPPATLADLYAD